VSIRGSMPARAILLLGPTGVGKTPLGNLIEHNGIRGNRCFHFDFGHELRNIAELALPPDGFREDDLSFIREVLDKGLLLENEHFHIAEKIMHHFLRRNDVRDEDILVLNGLPRHTDQAKDMRGIVDVKSVVLLTCGPDEVYKRIELNSGRDRTGRLDDSLDMIRNKLEIFKARTAPLIEYYSTIGAEVLMLSISAASTPEDTYKAFIAESGG
jgi:adenylate kinase